MKPKKVCGCCCGHPMTAYWAKGRNKKYAYYMCFNKECDDYRPSTRREQVEEEFEDLLKTLVPSKNLIMMAAQMFKDEWDAREGKGKADAKLLSSRSNARLKASLKES